MWEARERRKAKEYDKDYEKEEQRKEEMVGSLCINSIPTVLHLIHMNTRTHARTHTHTHFALSKGKRRQRFG